MSDPENTGRMLAKHARFWNIAIMLAIQMTPGAMMLVSLAALAASTSAGHAGACLAVLGAPQSIAAQMHHQPTTASVAAAEERLATLAYGAMRRARVRCRVS